MPPPPDPATQPVCNPRRTSPRRCRTGDDEQVDSTDCPQNVQLKWMAETTSSVYATPIITDLFADGYKDVVVPSFVHYLEVLQGDNGAQAAGFPAFHSDRVHASPLMVDADHDGVQDVLVATYSGEVLFYQDTGEQLPLRLTLPRLPVKRCACCARCIAEACPARCRVEARAADASLVMAGPSSACASHVWLP